ncbi:MAG: ABC transporter substrate-binding protein [Deltaproteobacteria bacterium]|nr:ABC transporter substrate-binding protein [Deltaproteobacteria bacterium]
MTKTSISIAYSPDTDDAFMVHALRAGLIDTGAYEFTFTAADIQQLNQAAKDGVYDVTAISIAAYPGLAAEYLLMPIGASIGDDFGPAIIVKPGSHIEQPSQLQHRKIAVPGLQTSAYFAARGLIGAFTAVPMSFLDIGDAVLSGAVDAGILIHELQLNCEQRGLKKIGDLGLMWSERYHLPLPLGANAIKRNLGADVITDVTAIMRRSIEVGLTNRHATLVEAMKSSKADLDLTGGEKYISMYVNRRSLALQTDVREAITQLFAIGADSGLCGPISLSDAIYE